MVTHHDVGAAPNGHGRIEHASGHNEQMKPNGTMRHQYPRLLGMVVLSFIAMYVLMYAMVDKFEDVYPSLNQFYMAALMTAAMVVIELVLMGTMYERKLLNVGLVVASVVALGAFWLLIRQQAGVVDDEFLRSMIPHHSGAILMCSQAPIQGKELKELCQSIIKSQDEEIRPMRRMLGK